MKQLHLFSALIATAVMIAQPTNVSAQVADAITTTNASGDWFAPAIWSGGNVPNTTTIGTANVFVNDGAQISLSTGNGSIFQSLRVGVLGDGTLTINGGTLITHSGAGPFIGSDNTIGGQNGVGEIIVNDPNSYLEFRGDDTFFGQNFPTFGGARTGTLNLSAGTVYFNGSEAGSDVLLGSGNSREGFFNITGGIMSFNATTRLRIGSGGNASGIGSFTMSGGSLLMDLNGNRAGDDINIGVTASQAVLNLSGTGFIEAGDDILIGVGDNSSDFDHRLIMSGGSISTEDLVLGNSQNNGGGKVDLSGGSILVSANLNIGSAGSINSGTSIWTQTGGTVAVDQNLQIGQNGAIGILTMNGGLIRTGDDADGGSGNRVIRVGYAAQALETVNPNPPPLPPSIGTLVLSGGTIHFNEQFDNNNSDFNIGQANNNDGSAFGHVIVNGTGVLTSNLVVPTAGNSGDLRLGAGGDEAIQTVTGRLDIADDAKVYVTRNLNVDDDPESARNSFLNISGGSTVIGFDLRIGQSAIDSSISSFNMSGGVVETGFSNTESDIIVSVNSNAVMNMTGGSLSTPDRFRVGLNAQSNGSVNISGGFLDVGDLIDMGLGSFSTGRIDVSGGLIRAGTDSGSLGGLVINSAAGSSSTVTFAMTGGTLELDRLDVQDGGSANSTHTFNGGVVRPLSGINGGNGNIQLEANNVANQLEIAGSTFDLQGGNITDNDTTTNQILISGGNVFNVASIDSDITMSDGAIQPSEDGVLRVMDFDSGGGNGVANNLTATDGVIIFDLFSDPGGAAAAVGTHASGIIANAVTLGVPVDVVIMAAIGFDTMTLVAGDQFDLIDITGGVAFAGGGTFDFSNAPLAPGLLWDTSAWADQGIIQVVIPEPASAILVFLSAVAFLRRRPGTHRKG
ncbi:MAG: hypothetical protein AAGD22_14210 [Verrucomicrobiota bacterium]